MPQDLNIRMDILDRGNKTEHFIIMCRVNLIFEGKGNSVIWFDCLGTPSFFVIYNIKLQKNYIKKIISYSVPIKLHDKLLFLFSSLITFLTDSALCKKRIP